MRSGRWKGSSSHTLSYAQKGRPQASPTLLLSCWLTGVAWDLLDPPPLLVLPVLLSDSLGQLRVVPHKEKQNFSCKPFLPSSGVSKGSETPSRLQPIAEILAHSCRLQFILDPLPPFPSFLPSCCSADLRLQPQMQK